MINFQCNPLKDIIISVNNEPRFTSGCSVYLRFQSNPIFVVKNPKKHHDGSPIDLYEWCVDILHYGILVVPIPTPLKNRVNGYQHINTMWAVLEFLKYPSSRNLMRLQEEDVNTYTILPTIQERYYWELKD